ncbi:MAG: hypothetical protein ACJA1E_000349 [Paracoccaceae bacterium]|jgi:hypothetical protein
MRCLGAAVGIVWSVAFATARHDAPLHCGADGEQSHGSQISIKAAQLRS